MRKQRSVLLTSSVLAIAITGGTAHSQSFSEVWEIMTRPRGTESPGCRGCHIGPLKINPWGDTEEEVLASLQAPDPFTGISLVDGGNNGSSLSFMLECGYMPFFGLPWHEGPDNFYPDEFFQFQLEKLREWLAQFDDPKSPPTSCQ
jgi:hypothetical protein